MVAKEGGVLRRTGHTEAAIDFARLAGLQPAGIIVEIMNFKGKVISVGNLVEGINVNDTVWYDCHSGHGIEFDDKFYFVIKASDIVLVD